MRIDKPILLFDGICNYCNDWVNFIIRNDKKKVFLFSPLQSNTAQHLLTEHGLYFSGQEAKDETVVVIQNGKAYLRTDATIVIAKNLGGRWLFFYYLLILIPRFMRDYFYKILAKNRYKWFGKKDSCMIPSPNLKERFLM